jgi:hypothetical protein
MGAGLRRSACLASRRAARGGGLVAVCCSACSSLSSLCRWLPDLVGESVFKVIWGGGGGGGFLDCEFLI